MVYCKVAILNCMSLTVNSLNKDECQTEATWFLSHCVCIIYLYGTHILAEMEEDIMVGGSFPKALIRCLSNIVPPFLKYGGDRVVSNKT